MTEPELRGDEIQGDSLAGFRKDHVALLFLRFDETRIGAVKEWLGKLWPRLATLNAVAQFNDAYRTMRRMFKARVDARTLPPDPELYAIWVNIAFTASGIAKLAGPGALTGFETAFVMGAEARAGVIGDAEDGSPGSPQTWIVGAGKNVPDAMLNIAVDYEPDLAGTVAAMRSELATFGGAIEIIHIDTGNAKIAPQKGHEHFGFRDGISQPAVRGILDAPTRPLLTPRLIPEDDPQHPGCAAPGVPLVQPGEFVLGYIRQDPDDPDETQQQLPTPPEPEWARDGSYLVYRRLAQNVPEFRAFLDDGAAELTRAGFTGIDAGRFGAMCVGRWKDGSPMARTPLVPDPVMAAHPTGPQDFYFWKDTPSADGRPSATMDADGQRCPVSAHIRKINPRDEATDTGHNPRTLRRRIIRRGVTYGPSYDVRPDEERGLLFLCYQASITDQFEFLWRLWANKNDTPRGSAGIDPIIGQNPLQPRDTHFVQGNLDATVTTDRRFIFSTGGAYLFAPSISAIRDVLAR